MHNIFVLKALMALLLEENDRRKLKWVLKLRSTMKHLELQEPICIVTARKAKFLWKQQLAKMIFFDNSL